jgi:predicted SAM-dependent methyltransferase
MLNISQIPLTEPLRIIIGAGEQHWDGWIPAQRNDLDLLRPKDWEMIFRARPADAFLCEHVWEHLTELEGRKAAQLCFKYLKPGGYLRCAVPDGNFPNPEYQKKIQVGGPGPKEHPAADHKIVYGYQLFADIFTSAGFKIDLLEYCDEQGRFHYHQWSWEDGPIYRSLLLDQRNREGKINSVSLILDAKKRIRL